LGQTGRIGERGHRKSFIAALKLRQGWNNCQQCGNPGLRQRSSLKNQQEGNVAILHGAAHPAMSLAGNMAMQNAKRIKLPATRHNENLATRFSGKKATRQSSTVAVWQFFMAAFAWLCYVLATRQCELPQDGSCQQCGIRQGGSCTPSPYSAKKAAPENPP